MMFSIASSVRADTTRLTGVTHIFVIWLLLAAWSAEASAQEVLGVERAFPALNFSLAVDIANDGLGYMYVVEQSGKIFRFLNDQAATDATLFLDLSDIVHVDSEAGLLSLAFHPDYEENGYFFVYYVTTDPLRSVVARYRRTDTVPPEADLSSEYIILEVEQPTDRHNGGKLAFDTDGYFYISFGDGSSGSDAFDQAQNLKTLLGSLLRIDVDNPSGSLRYGIPPDNPFVGNAFGYREEIFAYGFRNPWRFSIDPESGHIWIGDVGEWTWEEVDFVVKGGNYGWPFVEGPECYDPPENCSTGDYYSPVHSYDHTVGRSITGGFVYRGSRAQELEGKYIFADWGSGSIWALSYGGENPYESVQEPTVELIAEGYRNLSTFGVDENQELYFVLLFGGALHRFAASDDTSAGEPPEVPEDGFRFVSLGPNPSDGRTAYMMRCNENGPVLVSVYDLLGRETRRLFDDYLPAGVEQEVVFDAGSLPNGIYIVRAQFISGSTTDTIVLSR